MKDWLFSIIISKINIIKLWKITVVLERRYQSSLSSGSDLDEDYYVQNMEFEDILKQASKQARHQTGELRT